jgi:predicted GTPase
MTAEFIPRSDLVFFVTSADRPFTETERSFMEQIRGWGKKIVVVVNKSDILDGPAQVAEIRSFVSQNARSLLGFDPGSSSSAPGRRSGPNVESRRCGRRAGMRRWRTTWRRPSTRPEGRSSSC